MATGLEVCWDKQMPFNVLYDARSTSAVGGRWAEALAQSRTGWRLRRLRPLASVGSTPQRDMAQRRLGRLRSGLDARVRSSSHPRGALPLSDSRSEGRRSGSGGADRGSGLWRPVDRAYGRLGAYGAAHFGARSLGRSCSGRSVGACPV